MSTKAAPTPQITINRETVADSKLTLTQAQQTGSRLAFLLQNGTVQELPSNIEGLLMRALECIGNQGRVTIAPLPEVLTTTAAAELLGVSRPTLMKWHTEGRINATKVGTHYRFNKGEVTQLRAKILKAQLDSFNAMRADEDWSND